ncbi:MAG: hypothetical protein P4K78_10775 [Terracidiphilus sp.]|nr:hypothetical protein [Terracidiphilus sp.]
MKNILRVLILCVLDLLVVVNIAQAQRDNTFYATAFPDAKYPTVAAKVGAAAGQCNANVPCFVVVDSTLASAAPGTMPALAANVTILDYRKGAPYLGAQSDGALTGVRNAANYAGADWVAKVQAAAATIGTGGGTIFVPGTIAGTSTSELSLPGNVSLWFDAGLYAFAGPLNILANNHDIHGVGGKTILLTTGANDGVVLVPYVSMGDYPQAGRQTTIRDMMLVTSNASGGAALRLDYSPTLMDAPVHVRVENVMVNVMGSGTWAVGLHMANLQYSVFSGVTVIGATRGLYMAASEVNTFVHFRHYPAGVEATRCVEINNDSTLTFATDATFEGGGCFGIYSQSAIYNVAGNPVSFDHFQVSDPGINIPSDGAYVVNSGAEMDVTNAAFSGTVLNKSGGRLKIFGGETGAITLASDAAVSTIHGVHANGIFNNQSSGVIDLGGNSDWSNSALPQSLTFGQSRWEHNPGGTALDDCLYHWGSVSLCVLQNASLGSMVHLVNGYNLAFSPTSDPWASDTVLTRDGVGTLRVGTVAGYGIGGTLGANQIVLGNKGSINPTINVGSGAPSTACNTTPVPLGSLYSDYTGGKLYVCQTTGWTAK